MRKKPCWAWTFATATSITPIRPIADGRASTPMIRKNPAFNETYYGFSTFSKLLEDAAKQKIVTLERDEKSGTYVITALSEEGGRAA